MSLLLGFRSTEADKLATASARIGASLSAVKVTEGGNSGFCAVYGRQKVKLVSYSLGCSEDSSDMAKLSERARK
jgi:hypothetical protein